MTIVTCTQIVPWTIDEEKEILFSHDYFVRGATLSGGRYYSETMSWEKALVVFNEYQDIVYYYGGGIVELIGRQYDDYEIIKSKVCYEF